MTNTKNAQKIRDTQEGGHSDVVDEKDILTVAWVALF